ncbi:MAG: isochorismatase family protein [Actinomycetota bacterium]|nr:isochorismatase family protein [Actinomycetota bacterium]
MRSEQGEPGPHEAAFSGRIGWGARPALLVVDLCRAYTEPDGPFALPDVEPVVEANRALVAAARAVGIPVVWTAVRYAADLTDGGLFVRKVPALAVFAEGAEGGWGELTLEPLPDEAVVVKQYASGFTGRVQASGPGGAPGAGGGLAAHLTRLGVDTVVVTGVSTSGCVRATATDALTHGLHVQVVADACADRTHTLHEQNLADLDAKYADVVSLDQALTHLL